MSIQKPDKRGNLYRVQVSRFITEKAKELIDKLSHPVANSRKVDEDGAIRRTKVSMGTGEIHGNLWNEILKRQLQVTKEYFEGKL